MDTYCHVAGVGLGTNLANQRNGRRLCECGDGFDVKLVLECVLALIKGLVQDNGRLLDTLGLGQSSVACGAEQEVVSEVGSDGVKRLVGSLVVGGKVSDKDDLVGGLEVLNGSLVDDGDGGHGLLGHVRDDAGVCQVRVLFDACCNVTYAPAFLWPLYGWTLSTPRKTFRVG